jgi:hypothetical protein
MVAEVEAAEAAEEEAVEVAAAVVAAAVVAAAVAVEEHSRKASTAILRTGWRWSKRLAKHYLMDSMAIRLAI